MNFERMLRYCTLLELNNDRTWFHQPENHQLYVDAKQDFTALVETLLLRVADVVSPDLAQRMIFADPKAIQYRIPRDMRSNKGKLPYNPRFSADLSGDRHALLPIGYYVHIQPGGSSLFGTGAWCPDAEYLRNVRRCISEDFDRFSDALERCGCPMIGDRLKNVPKGFAPDDPAAEYLKFKSWLVTRSFADAELGDFDRFVEQAVETAERMEPLRRFFNDAFSGKRRNPLDPADWEE